MKRLFLLLIIILLIPLALATTLNEKDSITEKGKIITLKSVTLDKVVVDVDGISRILTENNAETINGVEITVNSISGEFETKSADLTINVLAECGDNNCSIQESSIICCKDCGCIIGLSCMENRCIDPKENKCSTNGDCNDNNINTTDLCLGLPRKCVNREKNISCSSNLECDDYNESTLDTCDLDEKICSNLLLETLNECNTDGDCNDNLISTKDKCIGIPKKCENINITRCESHDNYCPPNCTYPDDLNCKLCETNKDCDDNITCTIDSCDTYCLHKKILGCVLDNKCLPLNSTSIIENTSSYCFNETWLPQKQINSSCSYNFECETNLCNNSICTFNKEEIKLGFFSRIIKFFRSILSKF